EIPFFHQINGIINRFFIRNLPSHCSAPFFMCPFSPAASGKNRAHPFFIFLHFFIFIQTLHAT
ncbi:hypothetical protein, partial [Heyndrickxia faecalis]|uniref:hypothetical protein n=1 Tax=Heyndrickxia faecalis TaxID=2824910 RepID=UPI003EF50A51